MYNPYYFKTQSFTHLSVQETRETREKTQTRIFRSGSGQVSVKKFSGFSCHALEKNRKFGAGRVSDFFRFLHTLMQRRGVFANSKTGMTLTLMRVNLMRHDRPHQKTANVCHHQQNFRCLTFCCFVAS